MIKFHATVNYYIKTYPWAEAFHWRLTWKEKAFHVISSLAFSAHKGGEERERRQMHTYS
jgi:hypothetical protein